MSVKRGKSKGKGGASWGGRTPCLPGRLRETDQMNDRWTDIRANKECFPVANLTDTRMRYKWTGGVSGRTDRLDIERGRLADRVFDRQMDSWAYSQQTER